MTAYHWNFDPNTGTLYFPDGTEATTLGETDNYTEAAQNWAIGIVSEVGLSNLSDEQMMWLLSVTMEMITIGPPR